MKKKRHCKGIKNFKIITLLFKVFVGEKIDTLTYYVIMCLFFCLNPCSNEKILVFKSQ